MNVFVRRTRLRAHTPTDVPNYLFARFATLTFARNGLVLSVDGSLLNKRACVALVLCTSMCVNVDSFQHSDSVACASTF